MTQPTDDLAACDHVWKETVDSMYSNEYSTEVKCVKCGVWGQRDNKTEEVFWPAT